MQFHIIARGQPFPSEGRDQAYLRVDLWNDFSFVTMFQACIFDEGGIQHELGSVKIGFFGQRTSTATYSTLSSSFPELPDQYFSVGQDVEYYATLMRSVSPHTRQIYLQSLR